MSNDQEHDEIGFFRQCVALLVAALWIFSILIGGIVGSLAAGFLADAITPQQGKDSLFVQACVTVGGVVGAIVGGACASKLATALRRRYPR